jgi:8-oxo-dGTP pyrophosphatase MutT (NUDIX family)
MSTFTFDKKDPSSFPFNSIVVSAIIERLNSDKKVEILLQKRVNTNDSVYFGTLEIPAGNIEKWENVYDTLAREVFEETGLHIKEILNDEQTPEVSGNGEDSAFAFKPFMCQQYLKGKGCSWIGFSFRCSLEDGEFKEQVGETEGHHWISISDLKQMISDNPAQFFTLHLPILKYLINFHEDL